MAAKPKKTTKTTTASPTPPKPAPPPRVANPVAEKPAPARVAPAPPASAPTPSRSRVTFSLVRPDARAVFVAGNFNRWEPTSTPLKAAGGGRWSVELDLAPGAYEYRFVVDGQWIADPTASESVPNPFAGVNSVLRVNPPLR